MLTNKLFDPKDYTKHEFAMIKKYFESYWTILQMENIRFTYSSLNRAWEYGIILNSIDFREKKVLDLGTSISLVPIYMSKMMGATVVTFDQAFELERKLLYQWTGCADVMVDSGNLMHDLPYADGAFDIITCFSTIEHLPERSKAISEMKRVCRKGGYIGLTTDFMVEEPNVQKSGMTFNIDELLKMQKEFELPLYGEQNYYNVDLHDRGNYAVEKYTFASLLFENI